MKELFAKLYSALNEYERRVFWLGVAKITIGTFMLIYILTPPEWFGWQATSGTILEAHRMKGGLFSGGTTEFLIQFNTLEGETLEGIYTASPIIVRDFSTLKVYYYKSNAHHFYVYNPYVLIIAATIFLLGFLILLSYALYYRTLIKAQYNPILNRRD